MAMQDQTERPMARCPHCKEQCVFNVLDGQIPGDSFIIRQLFCSNKECHALLAVFPVAKIQTEPEPDIWTPGAGGLVPRA